MCRTQAPPRHNQLAYLLSEALVGRANVHRQLPSLGRIQLVVAALVGGLLDRVPSPEGGAELAVLRPHPVVVLQSGARPDRAGLLAAVGEVKGQPALALRVVEYLIKLRHADHRLLHLPHLLRIDLGQHGTVDRHSCVVN
eukprot:scaffold11980_cov98-Isochrysis_galbana.AAC.4